MKKPKRPFEWQEQDVDSPEDVGFDLDIEEEEEIIELEDILEMPDETDEPENSILDSESQEEDEETEEFAELSEFDLKDLELDFDSDEEDLLDDSLVAEFKLEEEQASEEQPDLETDAVQASPPSPEVESMSREEEVSLSALEDDSETAESIEAFDEAAEPAQVVAAPSDVQSGEETKPSFDEFVARIEDRLLEAVQQIVEARLPEIVRTVLREEIDRLQRDSETEKA